MSGRWPGCGPTSHSSSTSPVVMLVPLIAPPAFAASTNHRYRLLDCWVSIGERGRRCRVDLDHRNRPQIRPLGNIDRLASGDRVPHRGVEVPEGADRRQRGATMWPGCSEVVTSPPERVAPTPVEAYLAVADYAAGMPSARIRRPAIGQPSPHQVTQPMTRSRTSRRSVADTSGGSFGSLLPCWPNLRLRPAAFCFASFPPSCLRRQPVS